MEIVVHKYGGSSLATPDKVRRVADMVAAEAQQGKAVVTVVSAMGDTTDELLDAARQFNPSPRARELDMLLSCGEQMSSALLAMALQRLGRDAVALTGRECAIITDGVHGAAQIVEVQPGRVLQELARGRVVVAAGFQGMSPSGECTTLGRGGSDTTAIALAAALEADRCDICSDVDGVYTADPRVVSAARRIDQLDYDSMHELARQGARVLNADAVALARLGCVPIRARATFGTGAGTRIAHADDGPGVAGPAAVAGRDDVMRLRLPDTENREQILAALDGCEILSSSGGSTGSFAAPAGDRGDRGDRSGSLGDRSGSRGDRSGGHGGRSRRRGNRRDRPAVPGSRSGRTGRARDAAVRGLDLLVASENITDRAAFAAQLVDQAPTEVVADLGSVAVVGPGVGRPELAARACAALARSGIRPITSHTTPAAITCAVTAGAVEPAMRVLHDEFIEQPRDRDPELDDDAAEPAP